MRESLDDEQTVKLNLLLRLFNNAVNKIRDSETRITQYEAESASEIGSLADFIVKAQNLGFSNEYIKTHLQNSFGISEENMPSHLLKLME
jgi:hypothetical protein